MGNEDIMEDGLERRTIPAAIGKHEISFSFFHNLSNATKHTKKLRFANATRKDPQMSVTKIEKSFQQPAESTDSYSWTGWIESKYPTTILFKLAAAGYNDNSALFIGDELVIDNIGVDIIYSDPYTLKGKKRIAIYWSDEGKGSYGIVQFTWKFAVGDGLGCFDWQFDLGSAFFFHNPLEEIEP